MLIALSFVLLINLEQIFDEFCQYIIINEPDLMPLLEWFEKYYMGIMRLGRRQPARFDRQMWSVYQRVLEHLPRTNNFAGK